MSIKWGLDSGGHFLLPVMGGVLFGGITEAGFRDCFSLLAMKVGRLETFNRKNLSKKTD
jgi:hypothetical protein